MPEASSARGVVLFSAGAGGDPRRYSTLLEALARAGWVVVAPSEPPLSSAAIGDINVQERVRRLEAAFQNRALEGLPVAAIGHSFGAAVALCLAGARPQNRDRRDIEVPSIAAVEQLVLLAPAMDWFQAPDALSAVRARMSVHVGTADIITPPATAQGLHRAPGPVRIMRHSEVDHFDFMDVRPPTAGPALNGGGPEFLRRLAAQTVQQLEDAATSPS